MILSLQLHDEIEIDNPEVQWIKHPAPIHTAYVLGNILSHSFLSPTSQYTYYFTYHKT